jgi:hypothetical protein
MESNGNPPEIRRNEYMKKKHQVLMRIDGLKKKDL